ncbi:c-type cytochrome [Roseibium salinum]|uniref:Cytochrome c n=1 Tax=Roseibium salinum TaxID=1604349 RepID=A0ABT3R906_9HYPH|nr:cytochrome c [Roseibium sp. DSM 29163]MCX2725733.1 cytochrome c [Roseibium sp. DSM 29163]
MKKLLLFLCLAVVVASASGAAVMYQPIDLETDMPSLTGDPGRGAYLARMAGCIGCHTNGEQGGAPLAGGLALDTGFGTFYSPNLTTDPEKGIGDWSLDDFARAVRHGISPDGKPYYPAFPYPFYAKLSDQDIADLWAAFQTVPPAGEPSVDHDLSFPFGIREGLKLWRAAYLEETPFVPDPEKSEKWNRGKFIVEGPAHCGACHTPRNALGARQVQFAFHGAEGLPDGGKSPPITSETLKQNGWTIASLKYALQTGITPDGDVFGGTMGEVVRDGTAFLSDEDREAVATFLLENGG